MWTEQIICLCYVLLASHSQSLLPMMENIVFRQAVRLYCSMPSSETGTEHVVTFLFVGTQAATLEWHKIAHYCTDSNSVKNVGFLIVVVVALRCNFPKRAQFSLSHVNSIQLFNSILNLHIFSIGHPFYKVLCQRKTSESPSKKKKKMFSLQIESFLKLSTSKKRYNTSRIECNTQHIISW